MPYDDPPRVAADFVPHRSSARSRFRVTTDGEENSTAARDVKAGIVSPSWYRPRAAKGTNLEGAKELRDIQALWKTSVGANAAGASAYQNYLESTRRMGRGTAVGVYV